MDTTRLVVNAMPVYWGLSLPQAYDGSGVVMGVMDVGFDLTHPTFLSDDASRCRIQRFWDMLSPDTVGSRLPVGRDYGGSGLLDDVQHSADAGLLSHGTHTLGIAAGTGYDSPYRGMAPGSDLCLVSNAVTNDVVLIDSADLDKYTSATDALGFKYIFDYADSMGQPCVISFSEGFAGSFSEDDRLFCQFVDALLGPGHILVTSAGNESGQPGYINKPAGQAAAGAFVNTGSKTFSFFVRSRDAYRLHFLFYEPGASVPADSLSVDVASIAPVPSPDVAPDSAYADSLVADTLAYGLQVYKYASAFQPLDTVCYVELTASQPLYKGFLVAVVLSSVQADVELWGCPGSKFVNRASWADAEVKGNVLLPGTMPRVITVGATEHRSEVVNYAGELRPFTTAAFKGGISRYSSVGPTPEGWVKPDVCAPGINVISSYSSYYLEQNPNASDIRSDVEHFDYNGRTYAWNADSGTSMASPVVGGAIALWLQACPSLSPEQVMDVLAHTCRRPDASLDYPNNTYGHGEIDVHRGLLRVLKLDGIEAISPSPPSAATVRPCSGGLHLSFARVPVHAVELSVYSTSGQKLLYRQLHAAQADVVVPVGQAVSGVCVVQLTGRDAGVTGSCLVRMNN